MCGNPGISLRARSERGELNTRYGGEFGWPVNFINSQVSIVFYISDGSRQAFLAKKFIKMKKADKIKNKYEK